MAPAQPGTTGNETLRLIDGFYRAGSLVFGGGQVLPLLQAEVVETGLEDREAFLAATVRHRRFRDRSSPPPPTLAR